MIFNTALPAGGGGSSQWTDISSLAWTFSEEDVANIHAETNGSLVCLSAEVIYDLSGGSFSIYTPSGYEPSYISATQFTSANGNDHLLGNVIASTSGDISMYLTDYEAYSPDDKQSFTIIYPIA